MDVWHKVMPIHACGLLAAALSLPVSSLLTAASAFMLIAAGPSKAALARDTIYATVMIISSGVIGICLLLGGLPHRDYFLPASDASKQAVHADPPSNARSWISFVLLLIALVVVVGLAKTLSPAIEAAVATAEAPPRWWASSSRWSCCCPKVCPRSVQRWRTGCGIPLPVHGALTGRGPTR